MVNKLDADIKQFDHQHLLKLRNDKLELQERITSLQNKLITVNNTERETECAICMEIVDLVPIACGHRYCQSCVSKVIDQFGQCPECRKPV